MSSSHYERLSAMDTSFLVLEKPWSPLHVSATLIYEAGPMAKADGGIDISAYRDATESVLHRIPRYRQKLEWIPVVGSSRLGRRPRAFNLDYHVRHTSLPRPGTEEQLKKLSARIMAQPLDHSKPLWEAWLVEGLEGGRFAVISKIHHCMVDGMAGQGPGADPALDRSGRGASVRRRRSGCHAESADARHSSSRTRWGATSDFRCRATTAESARRRRS